VRPSRDTAHCARRRPIKATKDAGSIPATSTSGAGPRVLCGGQRRFVRRGNREEPASVSERSGDGSRHLHQPWGVREKASTQFAKNRRPSAAIPSMSRASRVLIAGSFVCRAGLVAVFEKRSAHENLSHGVPIREPTGRMLRFRARSRHPKPELLQSDEQPDSGTVLMTSLTLSRTPPRRAAAGHRREEWLPQSRASILLAAIGICTQAAIESGPQRSRRVSDRRGPTAVGVAPPSVAVSPTGCHLDSWCPNTLTVGNCTPVEQGACTNRGMTGSCWRPGSSQDRIRVRQDFDEAVAISACRVYKLYIV